MHVIQLKWCTVATMDYETVPISSFSPACILNLLSVYCSCSTLSIMVFLTLTLTALGCGDPSWHKLLISQPGHVYWQKHFRFKGYWNGILIIDWFDIQVDCLLIWSIENHYNRLSFSFYGQTLTITWYLQPLSLIMGILMQLVTIFSNM